MEIQQQNYLKISQSEKSVRGQVSICRAKQLSSLYSLTVLVTDKHKHKSNKYKKHSWLAKELDAINLCDRAKKHKSDIPTFLVALFLLITVATSGSWFVMSIKGCLIVVWFAVEDPGFIFSYEFSLLLLLPAMVSRLGPKKKDLIVNF